MEELEEKRQHRFQAGGKSREVRKRIKIQGNQEGNSRKTHFKRESVSQHHAEKVTAKVTRATAGISVETRE